MVGCFRSQELVGGICFEEHKIAGMAVVRNPVLTPFLGIHYNDNSSMNQNKKTSLQRDILSRVLKFLEKRYKRIAINNHYSVSDIRVFNWRNYSSTTRYTFIVDLSDPQRAFERIESRTRYDIRKCEKNGVRVFSNDDIETFHQLHESTYKRQGIRCPVNLEQTKQIYDNLNTKSQCKMYFAKEPNGNIVSTIFIIWEGKTAYYLMGANHPDYKNLGAANLLLKTAMEDLVESGAKTFDLCGANNPGIAMFKRGFGGDLKVYYRVEKMNSILFAAAGSGLDFINYFKRKNRI